MGWLYDLAYLPATAGWSKGAFIAGTSGGVLLLWNYSLDLDLTHFKRFKGGLTTNT